MQRTSLLLLFSTKAIAMPLCYQQPFTRFCCAGVTRFVDQHESVCDIYGNQLLQSSGYLEEHFSPEADPDGVFQEAFLKQGLFNTAFEVDMRTTWLGVNVRQPAQDLMVIQQLLFELRPKLVVETGTSRGGFAFFVATVLHLMDGMEDARIVTIDRRPKEEHALKAGQARSTLARNHIWRHYTREVVSDSVSLTARAVVADELAQVPDGSHVLVSLDADHLANSVWNEIMAYAPLVSVGSYLVIQDVILNFAKHPWPGPLNAVQALLRANMSLQRRLGSWHWDRSVELLGYTGHAYLKRVA